MAVTVSDCLPERLKGRFREALPVMDRYRCRAQVLPQVDAGPRGLSGGLGQLRFKLRQGRRRAGEKRIGRPPARTPEQVEQSWRRAQDCVAWPG